MNKFFALDEEDLDHELIIDLYKEAVEEQDGDAQYQLGEYYNSREGKHFQPEKSLKWFELASARKCRCSIYAWEFLLWGHRYGGKLFPCLFIL